MPFDPMPREFWERNVWCKSCRQPIGDHEPTETLSFGPDPEHRLEELNGVYHALCARPYLSVKRALDQLSPPFL
jgi:hypothetical protein